MTQVRPAVVSARITGAIFIDRPRIFFVARVLDDYPPLRGEQVPVPRIPRRQHAVHHVYAPRYVVRQLLRHPHPHGVTWTFAWQVRLGRLHHFETQWPQLAYREPSDGVTFRI